MGSFSFENQGMNTYLVYSADEDINFDTLSLGMLTNNKIEGLIPVVYSQLDNTRFLRYNITSKISLQQYFQGIIKRDQFVKVMYSLTKTMEIVREYMIPEQSIILDTDRIYIDISDSSAYMICLPILNKNTNVDMASFLKNIILSITFDEKEDCRYVTKVINYLNGSKNLVLSEFENILLELARGKESEKLDMNTVMQNNVNQGTAASVQQAPNVVPGNNFAVNSQNRFQQNNGVMNNVVQGNGIQNVGVPNKGGMNRGIQQIPPVQPIVNKKEKKKLFGGKKKKGAVPPVNNIPVNQVQQRVNNNKPNIIGMQIPGGAKNTNNNMNPMGDMRIPGQKVEFSSNNRQNVNKNIQSPAQPPVQPAQPPMQPAQPPVQPAQPPMQPVQPPMQPAQPPVQPPMQPAQPPVQPVQPPMQPTQPPMQPVQPPIQPVQPQIQQGQPQRQQPLSGSGYPGVPTAKAGETAVLSASSYQESLKPTLVRAKDGSRYTITQSILKIGREADYVDYCIRDNMAIGRCHANIITRDNQYYIVDNNSKNHTYVDGRMVSPGEELALSNGVKIMLANEEFEFKLL